MRKTRNAEVGTRNESKERRSDEATQSASFIHPSLSFPLCAFVPLGSLLRSAFRLPRSAFTLVELMVVVVILGLLATVVTVSVTDYLVKGKQSAAKAEIAQIGNALQLFYSEFDRYPDNEEGLALLKKPSTGHAHGILQGDLNDPWGHEYVYVYPGTHAVFDLCSLGADGQEGGEGAKQDLCNVSQAQP